MLNRSKGNMYPFVTHTFNTVKGECPHRCSYCYMKRFGKRAPLHFDRKELKTDLGSGHFIFVGSSCDMWFEDVPYEWVFKTLDHCNDFRNKYLFQSKNPYGFKGFLDVFPENVILGTTIETNRYYNQMGVAPGPIGRAEKMRELAEIYPTMVTIEPIMDFDLGDMLSLVGECIPKWVNIGADSQGYGLPEPSGEKIRELIVELKKFTEVKRKYNLKRLMR